MRAMRFGLGRTSFLWLILAGNAALSPRAIAQIAVPEHSSSRSPSPQPLLLTSERLTPSGFPSDDESSALNPSPWSIVPPVHEFERIAPTDWEYRALLDVAQRFALDLSSVPEFRADGQPLTRYEFVAILSDVMAQLENQSSLNHAQYVGRRDYGTLARLVQQFALDLEQLGDRLTDHESRTVQLEAHRFSPVARLHGEAVLAIADRYGDDQNTGAVFQHRLRLGISTTFMGQDAFNLRLSMGGTPPLESARADEADSSAEGTFVSVIGGNTDEEVELDWLAYTFPVGNRLHLYVSAAGGLHSHYVHDTFSPKFEDYTGGNGALSTFGQSSPIYSIGGGAGVGMDVSLNETETISLSAGYFAEAAGRSARGAGLFDGDYALLGQLTVTPSDHFQAGLTYVHGFHTPNNAIFDFADGQTGLVGTGAANAIHTRLDSSASTHSLGLQAAYRFNHRITLNAFGGYTHLNLDEGGEGDIWYYGLGLAFPDLVLPNSLAGLVVGVEPYLGGLDTPDVNLSNGTSLHVEVFYKLQLSDFISLTPGVIWLSDPGQGSDRDGVVISTFRTTFRF